MFCRLESRVAADAITHDGNVKDRGKAAGLQARPAGVVVRASSELAQT